MQLAGDYKLLIHELHPLERDKIAQWAVDISRPLWPYTPEGALSHGVWSQLIYDLAKPGEYRQALNEWTGCEDHWFANIFGINQEYLDRKLREWGFLKGGPDLSIEAVPRYVAEEDGSKKCTKCKKTKALTDYHKHPSCANGRNAQCKECVRKRARANDKKRKARKKK
jgi:hypothetical protein